MWVWERSSPSRATAAGTTTYGAVAPGIRLAPDDEGGRGAGVRRAKSYEKRMVGGQAEIFVTYSYDGDRQQVNLTNRQPTIAGRTGPASSPGRKSHPRPKGASPMRASLVPFLIHAMQLARPRARTPPLVSLVRRGRPQLPASLTVPMADANGAGGQTDGYTETDRPWSVFPGPRTGLI